jgi:hypothetical protein
MPKGLFDDIPIYNIARDKAWEAFIKRKDVKKSGMFSQGFPLEREYYELWCQAWHRAWDAGFKDGWESGYKFGHDVVSLASSTEGLKPRRKKT